MLKRIYQKLKQFLGTIIKQYTFLGIPIITISRGKPTNKNLFILFIPVLRITKIRGEKTIQPLVFAWISGIVKLIKQKLSEYFEILRIRKVVRERTYFTKPDHSVKLKEKLNAGEKLRIILFESRITNFQYGYLYDLLENSPYFEPYIVVMPFVSQGESVMLQSINETYDALKGRGYRVIKGYDVYQDRYLDVRKELNPDAVVYTMFWRPHFAKGFYIDSYEDIYSFLMDYGFNVTRHPNHESMNYELQNKVTRYYLYSSIHTKIAMENMENGGMNTFVTGAPKLDVFSDPNHVTKPVWKPQKKKKKRIIWAPHHSDYFPSDLYQFNAFWEIYDYMLEIAEIYKEDIQIAFKPHPMLKKKLEDRWGVQEANQYYEKWRDLENGQLETGEFIDLFIESDAMILDSISFIAEYTRTNKPAFFTIGKTTRVKLNPFGEKNFTVLYKTTSNLKWDIQEFIQKVVIDGEDTLKEAREDFIQHYLMPPNHKTASENIVDDMVQIMVHGNYRFDALNPILPEMRITEKEQQ